MKKLWFVLSVFAVIIACSSAEKTSAQPVAKNAVAKNDTIRIANDSLEYEIIIIDSGFNTWLESRAKPRNFYGLAFLENKNRFWVSQWNRRVLEPQRYNSNLYEMRIDYQPNIRYGYEVNYLLYNYFLYFQQEYKQKL